MSQSIVIAQSTRIRAAQGNASFFNPYRMEMIDNGMHASDNSGSWVTFDEGTELAIVGAYSKSDTYFLVVSEDGQGLDSESAYGLVVRGLSMQKILESAILVEEASTELVTTQSTALVAVAS